MKIGAFCVLRTLGDGEKDKKQSLHHNISNQDYRLG